MISSLRLYLPLLSLLGSVLMAAIFLPHGSGLTRLLYLLTGVTLLFGGLTGLFDVVSFAVPLFGDSLYARLFSLYGAVRLGIFTFGAFDAFLYTSYRRTSPTRGASREFPLLLLVLHLGGLAVRERGSLRDLLLALEIVTLASYVLVTYERFSRFSTYAGRNYFLVGSLPSAALLLSFTLFYRYGGSLSLQDLDLLSVTTDTPSYLRTRGGALLAFNLLFKLTAAPFHLWAPVVYGSAPVPTVTILSIYSKARVLFLVAKLLYGFLYAYGGRVTGLLLLTALLTLLVGRVGAFVETGIKRFFVFSSRGHVGFRRASMGLRTVEGLEATFHYLALYILSSFLRWFLLLERTARTSGSTTHLSAFATLRDTSPLGALRFALLIFSRSGIPPLGGFFIKLDVLIALRGRSAYLRTYRLFAFTVAGFFYYLRVVKILFFEGHTTADVRTRETTPRLWRRGLLFTFLLAYLLLVTRPLLAVQGGILEALLLSTTIQHPE